MKIKNIMKQIYKGGKHQYYCEKDGFLYITFDGFKLYRLPMDAIPGSFHFLDRYKKHPDLPHFFDDPCLVRVSKTDSITKCGRYNLRQFGKKKRVRDGLVKDVSDRFTAFYESDKMNQKTSPLYLMDDLRGDGSGDFFAMILPANYKE